MWLNKLKTEGTTPPENRSYNTTQTHQCRRLRPCSHIEREHAWEIREASLVILLAVEDPQDSEEQVDDIQV